MKTRIILGILLSLILSCSAPLPIEGTWTADIKHEQDGITLSGSQTYIFTPSGKKTGSFSVTREGKATLDNLGDLNFTASNPGVYNIDGDSIILANDTANVHSNISFHPTTFLGMLAMDEIKEYEASLRSDIETVNPNDTLKNVIIKDSTMLLVQDGETVTYLLEMSQNH